MNEVTEHNVGQHCLSEDECIAQGISFAAYERGVADAAKAFSMNTEPECVGKVVASSDPTWGTQIIQWNKDAPPIEIGDRIFIVKVHVR